MKQIAVITGASSGMGAEFARQLGAEPCADELWLLARRLDRLKELEAAQNKAREETQLPQPHPARAQETEQSEEQQGKSHDGTPSPVVA